MSRSKQSRDQKLSIKVEKNRGESGLNFSGSNHAQDFAYGLGLFGAFKNGLFGAFGVIT
jgi:hypothetical protein